MFEVYKVLSVRRETGKLVSYNTFSNPHPELELDYEVGVPVFPKIPNSLLFAFSDLKEALRFWSNESFVKLYKAITPWYISGVFPQCGSINRITNFWANYKNPSDSVANKACFMDGYQSFICCPSLILVEEIPYV